MLYSTQYCMIYMIIYGFVCAFFRNREIVNKF